ncbi:MAG: hypothetical protein EAY75_03960 [Bacteroidetes bacterium]|nr:MAG: hypothetical protein EAY75_03960 [Bacteroidota bacterium]
MILVRHTTPLVEKGICYGQTNLALADSFPSEAAAVQQQLLGPFSHIFTSPLLRCLSLAQYLHKCWPQAAPPVQVPALMELNFGNWENQPWNSLPQPESDHWMADFVNRSPPGGESFQSLYERCVGWYKAVCTSYPQALVVTHAGVMRCLLSHLHHTPLHQAFELYPLQYGQVVVL